MNNYEFRIMNYKLFVVPLHAILKRRIIIL
jgi:hypothetical protein